MMLIAIAIVISCIFAFIYGAFMPMASLRYGEYYVDSEKFKMLMKSQLFSGNLQGAIKVCSNFQDAVLVKWTKEMLLNHEDGQLDSYVTLGAAEGRVKVNEINRSKFFSRLFFHSFFYGTLGFILYVDGMTTGWVIAPIVLAYIWMSVSTLLLRLMRKEAVNHLDNLQTNLFEMKNLVVHAKSKNLFTA